MAEAPASLNKPDATKRSKGRDLAEIAIAYGLILLVIWSPRPEQRVLWWVAAGGVAAIIWISFDSFAAMGLRRMNFRSSFWVVDAALAAAGVAIIAAARLHTLRLPGSVPAFAETYVAYAVWSGVQQFLLQGFFLARLLRIAPRGWQAALAASVLFSAAHLPNPILTPITFLWGVTACLLFLHYRNLYPLALAHAILGITIAITVPGPVDHNMRVGLGYLAYSHQRHGRHAYRLEQPAPRP